GGDAARDWLGRAIVLGQQGAGQGQRQPIAPTGFFAWRSSPFAKPRAAIFPSPLLSEERTRLLRAGKRFSRSGPFMRRRIKTAKRRLGLRLPESHRSGLSSVPGGRPKYR